MKEIQKLVLKTLRNDEYFQFMTEMDKLMLEATIEALGITSRYETFKAGLTKVDSALKVERGSSQTALIIAADDNRDMLDRGFELQVESYSYHWDPDVVEAARRVSRINKQYGNLRVLGFNEETSAISNKVQELTSAAYAPDVEKMNLTLWLSKIDGSNIAFGTVFNDRANESAARASGNVRLTRVELDPAYEAIVNRINALVEVNGEAAYATFIDKVNYYVDYYTNTVKARLGRGGASDETKAE